MFFPSKSAWMMALCALCWQVSAAETAADTLPVPAELFSTEGYGDYAIGTFDDALVDETRLDTTTSVPDDPRHVQVQVWYPAEADGAAPRAPYVLRPALFEGAERLADVLAASHVVTNARLAVPVATPPDGDAFPVLLYNHGGGFPYFTATFLTEFFASQGYVVVSVNHAEASSLQQRADGTPYRADARGEADPQDRLHVGDIRFVLDVLAQWNATPGHRLYQKLDLARVGSMGWSMGGATAIQASRDEPRILAASNMDGFMWHRDVYQTGSPRPLLLWGCGPKGTDWSGDEDLDGEAAKFRAMIMTALMECMNTLAKSTSDWYQVNGVAIHHGSFSDLPLFAHSTTPAEQAEELAKHRRVHRAIQQVNLEFFDRYLRGRVDTPVLDRRVKPAGFDHFIMLRNAR